MSAVPVNSNSASLTGYDCSTCGRFVSFKPCQSDVNGNRGRLVAVCHNVSISGVKCDFIRWAPGSRSSTRSPSSSPPLIQVPTLPAPLPLDQLLAKKCPIEGCGQKRIAPDCASQWCRKHCVARYQGSCASKTHKRLGGDPIAAAAAATTALTTLKTHKHIGGDSIAAAAAVTTARSALTTSEPLFANDDLPSAAPIEPAKYPRCSSNLNSAFMDALAHDQELRDTRRIEDARRRESERRAKQTVKVLAWTVNGCEPTVSSFQSGFVWPFFNLSYNILEAVGLLDASDNQVLEMYDEGFGYWMKVDAGHVIEVREGHLIFLRSNNVEVCRGLEDHLATFRRSTPNFYGQLARERQYIRESPYPWEISTPRKRKASASPSASSSSAAPVSPASPPSPPDIIERPSASRHAVPTVSLPDLDETPPTDDTKEWPRDFHVCEVVKCFQDCKTSVKRGGKRTRTLAIVFQEYFPGYQFKSSTYHDQRNLWANAPAHLKKKFNEAGCVKNACWVCFSNAVRRHNLAKAAKQDNVIELSE